MIFWRVGVLAYADVLFRDEMGPLHRQVWGAMFWARSPDAEEQRVGIVSVGVYLPDDPRGAFIVLN